MAMSSENPEFYDKFHQNFEDDNKNTKHSDSKIRSHKNCFTCIETLGKEYQKN